MNTIYIYISMYIFNYNTMLSPFYSTPNKRPQTEQIQQSTKISKTFYGYFIFLGGMGSSRTKLQKLESCFIHEFIINKLYQRLFFQTRAHLPRHSQSQIPCKNCEIHFAICQQQIVSTKLQSSSSFPNHFDDKFILIPHINFNLSIRPVGVSRFWMILVH